MSFVEVSESTVTLLKVTRAVPSRISCRASGVTGASVVMTQIMVAMFGMIMPEPFTMPPTVTVWPASAPVAS